MEWLHDELERGGAGPGHRAQYASTAGSNETANGYFLERSHSARLTLEKACELLPDDDNEGDGNDTSGDMTSDNDRSKVSTETRRPGGSITSGQATVTSPTQQQNKQRMRRR